MAGPKHPRHYDEAFKRQIVRLYENGKPAREIKDEYDISHSTLCVSANWRPQYGHYFSAA